MGLDVYLYRFDDLAKTKAKEKRYAFLADQVLQQELARLSRDANDLSRDERNEIHRKTLAAAKDEDLMDVVDERDRTHIELDSALYPEHLFKIGYFRSNPSPGGLNNILRDRIGKSLYYVFFGNEDHRPEYEERPDWAASLARCAEITKEIKRYADKYGNFGVVRMPLSGSISRLEKDALDEFNNIRMSSQQTASYLDKPLSVHSVIPGDKCVFLIYERQTTLDWYFQALSVVTETCEWVLSRPTDEREKLYLIWSD